MSYFSTNFKVMNNRYEGFCHIKKGLKWCRRGAGRVQVGRRRDAGGAQAGCRSGRAGGTQARCRSGRAGDGAGRLDGRHLHEADTLQASGDYPIFTMGA